MALLVFLTFITLFTNTYIPIWMKENESSHMDQVLTQFGELKGKIDSLIVNAQVTQRPTINMYQTIGLSSDGVPIFASDTIGYLFLKPSGTYDSGVEVEFNYNNSGSITHFDDTGGGCVEYYAPNRYYVPQWYSYENGALMVYQDEGMAMRATPSLVFSVNDDGTVNVQFDQVDLIGGNDTIGGDGTAGIIIDLIYHDYQTYDLEDSSLVLKITTRYNATWSNFINSVANDSGPINYTLTETQVANEFRPIYILTLTIQNVNQFTHNRAYVNLDIDY